MNKHNTVVSDFSAQDVRGVTAATKVRDLMNKWTPVVGRINIEDITTGGYSSLLSVNASKLYRVGDIAVFYFHAELPAATSSSTENVYCYTLQWAPPVMFKDYRNIGTNYIRSCVNIDTDGKVYFRQTGGHIEHACTILFPIASEIDLSNL